MNFLITSNTTLAEIWAGFEKNILDPVKAPPEQRAEMKKAFYVGAMAHNRLGLAIAGEHAEKKCMLLFQDIENEIQAFVAELVQNVSTRFTLKTTGYRGN